LLRDTAANDGGAATLCFEGWRAILERRQLISPDGRDVPLTGGEFKLLSVFLKNPGRVLSRQHLMDITHGTGWHAYERTIDAQISRLRKKIEIDPKHPEAHQVGAWRWLCIYCDCLEVCREKLEACRPFWARCKINRLTLPG
jgi:DNA-binding response OmpR family regulator